MDENDIAKLEASITMAQEALSQVAPEERADLEAQIAAGQKRLTVARDEQQSRVSTLEEELADLKREKRDREMRQNAADLAQEVARGIKDTQEAEKERQARLIRDELRKVLGEYADLDLGVKGIVQSVLPEMLQGMRTGRKTPYEGGYPQNGQAGQGERGGQAPAFIPADRYGQEPDTAGAFFLAVGRKDHKAIAAMQRRKGIQIGKDGYTAINGYGVYVGQGEKALVEGAGWTDPVAGPSGGYVVPVEFLAELIPLLYPYVVLRRAGARVMTMRSPSFKQPRLTGGATASYVGESAPIPTSQETVDLFSLQARELVCMVPISKFLVQDADPNIEIIVREDMARQIGLKEDITFLNGTGGGVTPTGIFQTTGIQTVTPGTNGDPPTYKMITTMLNSLRKANIPMIRPAFMGPPDIQNALLNVVDSNGRPIFAEYFNPQQQQIMGNATGAGPEAQGPDGTLMGRPFYSSTQLPLGTTGSGATATLALVEMSQVVIGQLGGMELDAFDQATYVDGSGNTISAAQSAQIVYRAIVRHDIGVYHPKAIVLRPGIIYT